MTELKETGGMYQDVARIFSNGGSQAVHIPKECCFDVDEVYINKIYDF